MRFTPRTWMLLSLMLFAGAAFFWLEGNNYELRRHPASQKPALGAPAKTPAASNHAQAASIPLPKTLLTTLPRSTPASRASAGLPVGFANAKFRISNTQRSLGELVHDDRAILLRNALIDTAAGGAPEIPTQLKREGDATSYVVQSKGAVDMAFRGELARAKATIVSYVPNNAFLVEMTAESATALEASGRVQSVLPYEPYYKLSQRLLEMALEQKELPLGAMLRVTLFPNQKADGLQAIAGLGRVVGEEPSPFGPQVLIEPQADSLPALAKLASVQGIEPEFRRKPANDLTRVQVGLTEDTITNKNYLDLTGSNVWVNINDSGIDAGHPDLVGRVFSQFTNILADPIGHGTFVAATLAGDGSASSTVKEGTNLFVSATNANYRGMAPKAKLFELPLDFTPEVNARVSDTYLQETAALTNYVALGRTNSLISNNSWVYDGAIDYDSAAARYDAAVRDAVPGLTGEQPVAFIFPAGNSGFGNDDGTGGEPGFISSPGTAKNVITVGAVEHARFITNYYTNVVQTTDDDGNPISVTNSIAPFYAATDSSNQVASYSSRGNVGIGIEGTFGRVKPDVVAPGSFLISARSSTWVSDIDTNTPDGQVMSELNTNLGKYRIESGTTYAVPVVSGMMALFQEFFETKAYVKSKTLSPALMKALVINGARSANNLYDVSPNNTINYQGWGLVNLQRSIPEILASNASSNGPVFMVDQSPFSSLATGQESTWTVQLNTNAVGFPLRATLVWTDPPGNPNVGVKLVNDLDLIVTNLDTGYVFYGNFIESGNDFTTPSPGDADPVRDSVNNVENVFIRDPQAFGTNFTVTVHARHVNVDAVSSFGDGFGGGEIVQDYALVISSDNALGTNSFTVTPLTYFYPVERDPLTRITNGLPLFNQRVGANPVLFVTNGIAEQWKFFVFTNFYETNSEFNSLTNGSNVAFVTFSAPELSIPRTIEADIDLYVSRDPSITNLNPNAIANAYTNAYTSTHEGGTEFVYFTNAPTGRDVIYYIGVKSEDQQASEFSIMGVSSDAPFQDEKNGVITLHGIPFSQFIPDGSPNRPGGTIVLALGIDPRRIATIESDLLISHEDIGDLLGNLSHNRLFTVLNNHTLNGGFFSGTNRLIYNDLLTTVSNVMVGGVQTRTGPSDGPGTLNNFVGRSLLGPWILTMVDNAPSRTGRVESLDIRLTALRDLKGGIAVGSIGDDPISYAVDVPAGATNMIATVTQNGGTPIEMYLGLDFVPYRTNYDVAATQLFNSAELQYNVTNSPPLQPGSTVFLTLQKAGGGASVNYELRVTFGIDFNANNHRTATLTNAVALLDDARTNLTYTVLDDRIIADVSVGVRIDHDSISDLLLTLTSPQGTRVVLAENRGGFSANYGATFPTNRIAYTYFTEDTNLAQVPIKFATPPFYDSTGTNSQVLSNGFENVVAGVYTNGQKFDGWTVGTNEVEVISNAIVAASGTQYVSLEFGSIFTNIPTVVGREYQLSYASRAPDCVAPPAGMVAWYNAEHNANDISGNNNNGTATAITYTPGTVAAAFKFDGVSSTVTVPRSASLTLTNLTFDAWIFPLEATYRPILEFSDDNQAAAAHFWVGAAPGFPSTGSLFANIADTSGQFHVIQIDGVIPTNQWSFVAATYDQTTGIGRLFLNGQQIGQQNWGSFIPETRKRLNIGHRPATSLSAGANSWFLGSLDEVEIFNRALSANELLSIYTAGSSGKCTGSRFVGQVTAGSASASFSGGAAWQTNTLRFVATGTNTLITFAGAGDGIWIDSVRVSESGSKSYFPEEDLGLFKGERAYGDWRLDVYDTRAGQAVNASVRSWVLNLNYAAPLNLARPLNNGAGGRALDVLSTNQIHYYVIQPCDNVTNLTINLRGFPADHRLILSADRSGFPTGNPLTDDYTPLVSTGGLNIATLKLTTSSPAPAPLIPGHPIFLSIQNLNTIDTNASVYLLSADMLPAPGTNCPPLVVPLLGPSSAFTALLSSVTNAPALQSFSFNATSNATTITVANSANADLGFLVKQDALPTLTNYDYKQDATGSGVESLTVNGPGLYYVSVYNNSDATAPYEIQQIPGISTIFISNILRTAGGLSFTFESVPGADYNIQVSADLKTWSNIPIHATSTTTTYTDPDVTQPARFYRVQIAQ